MPSARGSAIQITRNGGFVACESLDGSVLYYLKDDSTSTLFTSRMDGSGESAVLSGVFRRGFALGPGVIYYARQEHDGEAWLRCFVPAIRQDSPIAPASNLFYLGGPVPRRPLSPLFDVPREKHPDGGR